MYCFSVAYSTLSMTECSLVSNDKRLPVPSQAKAKKQ